MNVESLVKLFRMRPLLSALLLTMSATPCFAVSSNAELERKLNQALQQIDQLKNKVNQLEIERKPVAPPTNAAAPTVTQKNSATQETPELNASQQQVQRIDQLEHEVSQISRGAARSSFDNGVPVHGFIDVGAASGTEDQPKGANIGKLDIYLTPQISDRTKALVELIFEVNDAGNLGTDLERLQLGYVFSDSFTLWAGRFHTPYGYWNTAYHHGAQIQTSILRPKFLDFEDAGGILPAHNVGAWGTGGFKVGTGKISYDVIIVNGPRIDNGTLNPNLASDDNHSAMLGANLGYLFADALEDWKVGVDWLRGTVNSNAYIDNDSNYLAATKNELNMYGAYLTYLPDDWEFLNEYYVFEDKNTDGGVGTHHSWAAYSQLGYRIESWTPYARVEGADLDQADNYFATQENGGSYERGTLGLRFDIDPKSVLKWEINRTRYTDRDKHSVGEGRFQFAVRF